MIDKVLEARLSKFSNSDPEKARLQDLLTVLESELQIAATITPYEKLGFNPDYLMHSPPLTSALYRYTGDDEKKFRAFCLACYKDAALYDPLAFERKISVQFTHFLFPKSDTFYKGFGDFSRFYQGSVAVWEPNPVDRFSANVAEMYQQYRSDLVVQAGAGPQLGGERKFDKFRRAFAPFALRIESLFLLAFVASLIWAPLRGLRLSGWAAVSLFSAPLSNAVTVCVLHALDIDRYRRTYGGFLLFALVVMALFAALVIARSVFYAAEVFFERASMPWAATMASMRKANRSATHVKRGM